MFINIIVIAEIAKKLVFNSSDSEPKNPIIAPVEQKRMISKILRFLLR